VVVEEQLEILGILVLRELREQLAQELLDILGELVQLVRQGLLENTVMVLLEILVLLEKQGRLVFMEEGRQERLERMGRLVLLARLVCLVQLVLWELLVGLDQLEVEVITDLLGEMDQLGLRDGLDQPD
jgi:hypothetical protein